MEATYGIGGIHGMTIIAAMRVRYVLIGAWDVYFSATGPGPARATSGTVINIRGGGREGRFECFYLKIELFLFFFINETWSSYIPW